MAEWGDSQRVTWTKRECLPRPKQTRHHSQPIFCSMDIITQDVPLQTSSAACCVLWLHSLFSHTPLHRFTFLSVLVSFFPYFPGRTLQLFFYARKFKKPISKELQRERLEVLSAPGSPLTACDFSYGMGAEASIPHDSKVLLAADQIWWVKDL